jgi:molecular chaperone GrpE
MKSFSIVTFLAAICTISGFSVIFSGHKMMYKKAIQSMQLSATDEEIPMFEGKELQSDEITKLRKKIDDISVIINGVREERKIEEAELTKLEEEFGSEITRIKKEFSRIKERSIEEATDTSNKAKSDALKEVLPIADNYGRAKSVYEPVTTDGEKAIMDTYDQVFVDFTEVIKAFGVSIVPCLGQKYDYNFMEAIMTAPSTEYAADIVSKEYQVGYRMGDKCIRPAMVVVSTGPGPSK